MPNVLFIVNYCNNASNQIVPKQKELVSSSGYSSYTKWVDFPHTHTHQHMRTSRIFCIFAVHWRIYPFRAQLFSFPCSFRGKFAKLSAGAPSPLENPGSDTGYSHWVAAKIKRKSSHSLSHSVNEPYTNSLASCLWSYYILHLMHFHWTVTDARRLNHSGNLTVDFQQMIREHLADDNDLYRWSQWINI